MLKYGLATVNRSILRPGVLGAGYDAAAEAFFAVNTILNSTQKDAINALVVALKGYGLWDKLDCIYPFVGGTADAHKWNLKDPRDLDAAFRLTYFVEGTGSVNHTADGLDLNPGGVSADNGGLAYTHYTSSVFAPGGAGSSFNFNMSAFSRRNLSGVTNGGLNSSMFQGSSSSGTVQVFFYSAPGHYGMPDRVRVRIGGSTDWKDANTTFDNTNNGTGMYTATSVGATQISLYHNGSVVNGMPFTPGTGTRAAADPAVDNRGIPIGGLHNTDAPPTVPADFFGSHYSVGTWSFFSLGKVDLTAADAANLNTAVTAYQTALGRATYI